MVKKKKKINLTRFKADELLAKLIERAKIINSAPDTQFTHTVNKLAVFGSYLTDKEKLGDLDIAVEIKGRWSRDNAQEFREMLFKCEGINEDNSRTFMGRLFFPERKLMKFLKNRSTAISLHTWSEVEGGDFEHKVIFEKE